MEFKGKGKPCQTKTKIGLPANDIRYMHAFTFKFEG